ncbi:MAG TPA: hypothetical protein VHC22_24100 [Pirellulales bacterium]|nr:hypothetical protein [Pirellulales bacterium]
MMHQIFSRRKPAVRPAVAPSSSDSDFLKGLTDRPTEPVSQATPKYAIDFPSQSSTASEAVKSALARAIDPQSLLDLEYRLMIRKAQLETIQRLLASPEVSADQKINAPAFKKAAATLEDKADKLYRRELDGVRAELAPLLTEVQWLDTFYIQAAIPQSAEGIRSRLNVCSVPLQTAINYSTFGRTVYGPMASAGPVHLLWHGVWVTSEPVGEPDTVAAISAPALAHGAAVVTPLLPGVAASDVCRDKPGFENVLLVDAPINSVVDGRTTIVNGSAVLAGMVVHLVLVNEETGLGTPVGGADQTHTVSARIAGIDTSPLADDCGLQYRPITGQIYVGSSTTDPRTLVTSLYCIQGSGTARGTVPELQGHTLLAMNLLQARLKVMSPLVANNLPEVENRLRDELVSRNDPKKPFSFLSLSLDTTSEEARQLTIQGGVKVVVKVMLKGVPTTISYAIVPVQDDNFSVQRLSNPEGK